MPNCEHHHYHEPISWPLLSVAILFFTTYSSSLATLYYLAVAPALFTYNRTYNCQATISSPFCSTIRNNSPTIFSTILLCSQLSPPPLYVFSHSSSPLILSHLHLTFSHP
ncbi:hypothetical protein AMTR_s00141p00098030 [Amborella trichopoda]|uniref:Uncharacterized protein n=1 Tax=Amborella trichopoda TaxID=13333 RepID=W1PAT2_AMBTC|nr:hypothetical protein AMTR_s00141p00098030 [Amborella trichopoda]